MKYAATLVALFLLIFFSTELDLPILPPDDPRREEYVPATLPVPPPVVEDPVPPPVFFGEMIPETSSIVYVLDFSQSMSAIYDRIDYRTTRNRWQVAQQEATRSISALAPSIKFGVVVYGTAKGACGVRLWQNQLSTDKPSALAFIASFDDVAFNGGATPTGPAILAALALEPEVIVLLTDGEPSQCGVNPGKVPWISHRDLIRSQNSQPVPIQVFGIGLPSSYAREFCMGVASDSTGTFVEIR